MKKINKINRYKTDQASVNFSLPSPSDFAFLAGGVSFLLSDFLFAGFAAGSAKLSVSVQCFAEEIKYAHFVLNVSHNWKNTNQYFQIIDIRTCRHKFPIKQ